MTAATVLFSLTPALIAEQAKKDGEQFVLDDLANANQPPAILGEIPDQTAKFPADYDWTEQRRILRIANEVIDRCDEVWPTLVRGLDDRRYSITFEHPTSVRNYTVGQICRTILEESLSAGYDDFIPADEAAYRWLRVPDYVDRQGAWWRKQHANRVSFVDLQIRAAEWASGHVETLDFLPFEVRHQSAAGIRTAVEHMSRTRIAQCGPRIILTEWRTVFPPPKK